MNGRLIVLFTILFSGTTGASAQQDPVAGKILERFSEKALQAPAVTMQFTITLTDAIEGTSETVEGEIEISGNRYRLSIPDNIIWYNGEAVWTYTPDFEEVTITDPDTTTSLFITNPSALFSLHREGYKYRLMEETAAGSVIDLYPGDINTDFSRIRLLIGRDGSLAETEYKRKDGITLFLKVNSYDLGKSYPDSWFAFDRTKYSNAEIIDMRF
ncbi:MAG: outer membrane lipoprotein carrier protein LolA [Bacteroidales bacterium]|nr:outer membrane lipoprotein carrier protein LolA [Bacteroidales bacterium]